VGAVPLSKSPMTAEQIFWGVRKLFEYLGSKRSLVVFFDDIQWAEGPSPKSPVKHGGTRVHWHKDDSRSRHRPDFESCCQ